MTAESASIPALGVGLGLRRPHVDELLAGVPEVAWLEVIPENVLHRGGRLRAEVRALAARYPIALHGLAANLASTDPLDYEHLEAVAALAAELGALWISDHLCFTAVGDRYYGELLPPPFTLESARHVAARIRTAAEVLGRPLLVENVSRYVEHDTAGRMPEWEWVARVVEEADCLLLLDVNNVFVNARNFGFDPRSYLDALPFERVAELHMAGCTRDGGLLVDTHGEPVWDEVWALYEETLARLPRPVPVLLERDAAIPPLSELLPELRRLRRLLGARFQTLPAAQAQGGR